MTNQINKGGLEAAVAAYLKSNWRAIDKATGENPVEAAIKAYLPFHQPVNEGDCRPVIEIDGNMVEKVARAICKADGSGDGDAILKDGRICWTLFITEAKAAIGAYIGEQNVG